MKAFVETIGKEYFDDFVYTAIQPLIKLGYNIIKIDGSYSYEKLNDYIISNKDIAIGSVEFLNEFFIQLSIDPPKYIGFPNELNKFYGRKIDIVNFNELFNLTEFNFFIKPYNNVKLFTGCLIEQKSTLEFIKKYELHNLTEEEKFNLFVYKQEKINFISEYRCFIHKGKLVGIKHYKGDFTKFIDVSIINDIISEYKNPPIAYTLDIGLCENNNSYLIEINDFWAIGGYGLDGEIYSKMIIDRIKEIVEIK